MDNYEIYRKLSSQGACGQVFFARDKRNNNSTVVVKQLPASDARSAIERRVMRNLRHANIVRFLDSWVSMEDAKVDPKQQQQQQQQQQGAGARRGGPPLPQPKPSPNKQQQAAPGGTEKQLTLNIAMEFCKGGDLRTAIRARRQAEGQGFPEEVIRKWLVQICSALYYCHIQHIIHRDLKAENVLLDETGSQVKLADFGFAKELEGSAAFATTRLGTPHSLPPEVYDFTPYNNRADMWCVGVILYELMTLARPFLGNTTRELFDTIMKSEPVPAEQLSRQVGYSRELYELQKRLLSKNPKNRPSAREILEYTWASGLMRDLRLVPLSEEQRKKERGVWDRITVQAQYDKTAIMELALPGTSVNVRNAPDFERSKVLCQLHVGDVIEVIDEIVDAADLRWFRTTKGFCIKMTPMPPPRDMFRRIAEWRVHRPSAAHKEQQQQAQEQAASTTNKLAASPCFTSPTGDDGADQKSSDEAAKAALEAQCAAEALGGDAKAARRSLVTALLQSGMPEETLEDLLARYRDLSAPMDDMPWTMYCVDALRPLKLVPWIPVIRTVALATPPPPPEQQQQQQQQSPSQSKAQAAANGGQS